MRAVIDLNILSCGEAVAEIKSPHNIIAGGAHKCTVQASRGNEGQEGRKKRMRMIS